jgi:hypothetical protein
VTASVTRASVMCPDPEGEGWTTFGLIRMVAPGPTDEGRSPAIATARRTVPSTSSLPITLAIETIGMIMLLLQLFLVYPRRHDVWQHPSGVLPGHGAARTKTIRSARDRLA